MIPLEVIAARALAKAVKGKSLKGYLEKEYKRHRVPDAARPVVVGLVSQVSRKWMVLAKALGYPYERPKASVKFWKELVIAYQALYRKVGPSKVYWAFSWFPKDVYLELLRLEPEDVVSDLGPGERERVLLSVPKWVWNEISKFADPEEFVLSLDERKHFWVRVRSEDGLRELKKLYDVVEESPLPDVYKVVGPMRKLVRSKLMPTKVVVMELASATIAHLAKGKSFVDLTSAPGGKALHASDLGFFAVANDLDVKRIAFPVEAVRSDARLPAFRRGFDTVLLDPDCTGIGRLHSPETRLWLATTRKEKLAEYQKQLLKGALSLVREGSRFIYSTCTITFEENEAHAELIEERGLEPVDVEVASPGLRRGWRRYFPHVHETIGFTIAVYEQRKGL